MKMNDPKKHLKNKEDITNSAEMNEQNYQTVENNENSPSESLQLSKDEKDKKSKTKDKDDRVLAHKAAETLNPSKNMKPLAAVIHPHFASGPSQVTQINQPTNRNNNTS